MKIIKKKITNNIEAKNMKIKNLIFLNNDKKKRKYRLFLLLLIVHKLSNFAYGSFFFMFYFHNKIKCSFIFINYKEKKRINFTEKIDNLKSVMIEFFFIFYFLELNLIIK